MIVHLDLTLQQCTLQFACYKAAVCSSLELHPIYANKHPDPLQLVNELLRWILEL